MSSNTFEADPLDNVVNLLTLPRGHEKAFKHALYNALALFLLAVASATGWALFIILGPFIKPLAWALLCGSVLHPMKHRVASYLENLLAGLSSSPSQLLYVLDTLMTPFKIVNNFLDSVVDHIVKNIKAILSVIGILIVIYLLYNFTPQIFFRLVWRLGVLGAMIVNWLIGITSFSVVLTVALGYVGAVTIWWNRETSKLFTCAAYGVWLLVSFYISNLLSFYQLPVFCLTQFLVLLGYLYEVWTIYSKMKALEQPISLPEAFQLGLSPRKFHDHRNFPEGFDQGSSLAQQEGGSEKPELNEKMDNTRRTQSVLSEEEETVEYSIQEESEETQTLGVKQESVSSQNESSNKLPPAPPPSVAESLTSTNLRAYNLMGGETPEWMKVLSSPQSPRGAESHHSLGAFDLSVTSSTNKDVNSSMYLYFVLAACMVTYAIKYHANILQLTPIVVCVYSVKYGGNYLGLWSYSWEQWQQMVAVLSAWSKERADALMPRPVQGLFKLASMYKALMLNIIKDYIHMTSTVLVIVGLMAFSLLGTVFMAIQMYAEGFHVLQLGANMLNQTMMEQDALRDFLPADWDDRVHSLLDNAYVYGREKVHSLTTEWMQDVEPEKAAKVQEQVLALWDRLYQLWLAEPLTSPALTAEVNGTEWGGITGIFDRFPGFLNVTSVTSFARENVDMLVSVVSSVWEIFRGNISLALYSLWTIISIVFGGGTAVLNFILSVIVFFSALFYLLTSSGELYKPVEMITEFSPVHGNRLAVALEDSVNSVFKASFKLALFYGLWTWFLHTLFAVKLVYLPSVLAAILGAIPFLGPYWATLPGVVDLWFVHMDGARAIALVVSHYIGCSWVTAAFYQEIRGSHPYLTGLAIAGGIICLGMEGALLGPLLVCGLLVAVNMWGAVMRETPTEEFSLAPSLSHLTQQIRVKSKWTATSSPAPPADPVTTKASKAQK